MLQWVTRMILVDESTKMSTISFRDSTKKAPSRQSRLWKPFKELRKDKIEIFENKQLYMSYILIANMTPPHFYKTKSFQNKLLETFSTFTEQSGVKTFLLSPGKTDMLSELFRTIHSSFLPFFKTKEENKTYIFLNCTFVISLKQS